jgi:broad specificity phosphatase PhoE
MKGTQPCTIYLVRHGETHWNVQEIMQGHTDIDLTARGEEQAMALAKELKHIHFDAVFSSDLIRAKKTAHLISAGAPSSIITTPLLRERAFGNYEGKPATSAWKVLRPILDEHHGQHPHLSAMNVETNNSMRQRIMDFLLKIASEYQGKTLLLVSHGGVLKQTLIQLNFATASQFPKGAIQNTAYIRLSIIKKRIKIEKTQGISVTPSQDYS